MKVQQNSRKKLEKPSYEVKVISSLAFLVAWRYYSSFPQIEAGFAISAKEARYGTMIRDYLWNELNRECGSSKMVPLVIHQTKY